MPTASRRAKTPPEPGRALREAAAAPARLPPTTEAVERAKSYWPKPAAREVPPESRGSYEVMRERAAASRVNTPVREEVVETAPIAPEPKAPPTDEEIAAAHERFTSYRDATAKRRRQELGLS